MRPLRLGRDRGRAPRALHGAPRAEGGLSTRPIVLASAAAGPLLQRAAGEAERRFPGAPLLVVVHWRAAASVPPHVERVLASEYRDRPGALVGTLRARRPLATLVVCDGEPGATLLKVLALCGGGERLVMREDGSVYRLPWDAAPLARHLLRRLAGGVGRVARLAGALCGLPVLLAGAWRWRRRS